MKIISNKDVYADTLSSAAIATVPFIAIGIVGHPIVLYVSIAIGILSMCTFLIRFVFILHRPDSVCTTEWVANLMSLLQLPYFFAIAAYVLSFDGVDAVPLLWVCLGLAILIIACIPWIKAFSEEP